MSGKPKTKPAKGWGGKRAGSGAPKKPQAPPIERPAAQSKPVTPPIDNNRLKFTGQTAQELAKLHLDLAIETLVHIATVGVNEGPRVSAAKIIIETATGKPAKGVTETVEAKPIDKWGAMLDEARPH